MTTEEQIKQFIDSLAEAKREDMLSLHQQILNISPGCKVWFFDGKDSENKVVTNPNIGYGSHTIKYANGKSAEWFKVSISGNKTGISVYILGIKDKTYLAQTFGSRIGKAGITGYCIKFKHLKDIDISILEAAIQYGLEHQEES